MSPGCPHGFPGRSDATRHRGATFSESRVTAAQSGHDLILAWSSITRCHERDSVRQSDSPAPSPSMLGTWWLINGSSARTHQAGSGIAKTPSDASRAHGRQRRTRGERDAPHPWHPLGAITRGMRGVPYPATGKVTSPQCSAETGAGRPPAPTHARGWMYRSAGVWGVPELWHGAYGLGTLCPRTSAALEHLGGG
jgi:hypothetical protein